MQKIHLMKHQKGFVESVGTMQALLWEPGTGKTLAIVHKVRDTNYALIICPPAVKTHWQSEFLRCFPKTKTVVVPSSGKAKLQALSSLHKIRQWSPHVVIMGDTTISDPIAIKAIQDTFKGLKERSVLVVDESHRFKNHQAKRTKAILKVNKFFSERYILTGTLIAKNELDLYTQYQILLADQNPLGESYFKFRSKFFTQNIIYTRSKIGTNFFTYKLKPHMESALQELLMPYSNSIKKKDVLDLPKRTYLTHDFDMSDKQWLLYNSLCSDLVAVTNGEFVTVTQEALGLALQRICSNHITKAPNITVSIDAPNRRLQCLQELLETYINQKIIVWATFISEYDDIKNLIVNIIRRPYTEATGRVNTTQKENNVKLWKQSKDGILLAHPASLGTGVNLQEASVSIYYSRSYNLIDRLQSLERNYRLGTTKPVITIDIVAKNTIDEHIKKSLDEKKQINTQMIVALANQHLKKQRREI